MKIKALVQQLFVEPLFDPYSTRKRLSNYSELSHKFLSAILMEIHTSEKKISGDTNISMKRKKYHELSYV